MADRRAFLIGAGAAVLALAAGVPAGAAIDFDPADIFAELHAAGLDVWWARPIGLDAPAPYYCITPKRGGFTRTHLDLMAKWADVLEACPIRAASMEAWLASFERGEQGQA